MEDWGQYILLIIFAAISLAKSFRKDAEEENETEEANEEATADKQPMPPFLPLEEVDEAADDAAAEEAERARRAAARRQRLEELRRRRHEEMIEAQSLEEIPAPAYEQPISLETIVNETTAPTRPSASDSLPRVNSQPLAQLLETVKSSRQATAQPEAVQPAAEQEGSSLAAEFDLERAVIYSEVLKPKYQEYE